MAKNRQRRSGIIKALGGIAISLALAANAGELQFIVGTTTHFCHASGISVDENLSVLAQGGIVSPRDDIAWRECEKAKGVLKMPDRLRDFMDRSASMGLSPLPILDYGNSSYDGGGYPKSPEAVEAFVRYCEFVVGEFKGKCKLYQVWNEWDGGCGMPKQFHGKGDPKSYMELLKAVYPRIKAVDPSITVVSGSVCHGEGYLKSLLELGMLKHCDVASFHTYNYYDGGTPEAWHERMLGVDKLLRQYNDGKEFPMYITEMGWPTQVSESGATHEESADYLVRLYLLAKTLPFIKGVWWYDFQDDGWDWKYNENNFGMTRPDLTPKKSYYALKDLAPLLKDAFFVERIDAGDPKIWILRFKSQASGKDAIALWSAYKDDQWQITLKSQSESVPQFKLLCPGEGFTLRNFGARDWAVDWAAHTKAQLDKSLFQVSVRGRPCIMEGDLGQVQFVKLERRVFPERARPKNSIVRTPEKIGRALHVASKGAPESYDFGHDRFYRRILGEARAGRKDLDASFTMRWDEACLHIAVDVADDVFKQDNQDSETWKGDGVQMAFQTLGKDGADPLGHTDFDVALSPKGPVVFRQYSQGDAQKGVVSDIKAKIFRDGEKTRYEIDVPAKSIGMDSFKAGSAIGFSLLVNDDDGTGRKGYLRWGDGIGQSKSPSQYNWMVLEE